MLTGTTSEMSAFDCIILKLVLYIVFFDEQTRQSNNTKKTCFSLTEWQVNMYVCSLELCECAYIKHSFEYKKYDEMYSINSLIFSLYLEMPMQQM